LILRQFATIYGTRWPDILLGLSIQTERELREFPIFIVLAALLTPAAVRAQLMLPGALQVEPPAGLDASSHAARAASKKPKLAGLKPPSVETILGRDLARDGSAGTISFRPTPEKGIEITKLSLSGEGTSYPMEPCLVDAVAQGPIQTRFRGRPNGLFRYEIDLPACPFSFEVLEGAVLVTRSPRTCEFAEAQCRVDPSGLWGPPGNSFGPVQGQRFERERSHAEADMRTNFRALLTIAGKDKEAIQKIAGEQAGFSSVRETTCHSYLKEDVHGYCALRLTQARALALQAAYFEQAKMTSGSGAAKALEERTIAKRKPAAKPEPELKAGSNPEPGTGSKPAAAPE
jgi:hypothetical protein